MRDKMAEDVVSFLNGKVFVKVGNIVQEKTDAVVNAANSTLLGGGGVDGAIHSAGGPQVLDECKAIRKNVYQKGLPDGKAVITGSGNLPSRYIIHTVGPVWSDGNSGEEEKLAACYRNSLQLALDNQVSSISFPAISTGVFGYPRDKAAVVSSGVIKQFLTNNSEISEINFVFFSIEDKNIFMKHQVF